MAAPGNRFGLQLGRFVNCDTLVGARPRPRPQMLSESLKPGGRERDAPLRRARPRPGSAFESAALP